MARNRTSKLDLAVFEAAIIGLELRRQRPDEQIAEIRRRLGKAGPTGRKGRMSAAARKRIAALNAPETAGHSRPAPLC